MRALQRGAYSPPAVRSAGGVRLGFEPVRRCCKRRPRRDGAACPPGKIRPSSSPEDANPSSGHGVSSHRSSLSHAGATTNANDSQAASDPNHSPTMMMSQPPNHPSGPVQVRFVASFSASSDSESGPRRPSTCWSSEDAAAMSCACLIAHHREGVLLTACSSVSTRADRPQRIHFGT